MRRAQFPVQAHIKLDVDIAMVLGVGSYMYVAFDLLTLIEYENLQSGDMP